MIPSTTAPPKVGRPLQPAPTFAALHGREQHVGGREGREGRGKLVGGLVGGEGTAVIAGIARNYDLNPYS